VLCSNYCSLVIDSVISRRRKKTKYLRQQQDVAAVEVTLIEDETGWSPYLSLEDAEKLDQVREALRQGDLDLAAQYGQVYKLRPIKY